jgi:chemotaxis protein histidine kinase CheA
LSELENQLEQISAAVRDLRAASGDGPSTRKQLDSLFRRVHNLKATASAGGFKELTHSAHELENVLHALRTGKTTLDDHLLQELTQTSVALSETLPAGAIPAEIWSSLKAEEKHSLRQSAKEGANLFLIQTSFDVADFDRQFQKLKETLSGTGEVISIAPQIESDQGGKINFRILYAQAAESSPILTGLSGIPGVSVEALLSQAINSLGDVLQRAVHAGESAAGATGKAIDFEVRGADLSLERSVYEVIAAPLIHLVRNAVDHGIEPADERVRLGKHPRGKIVIEVVSAAEQSTITITDDGRGIDASVIPLIFQPGFSTRTEVSEISGRGVGLDVVQTTIEDLGGSVTVSSDPGKGSTFKIMLIRANQ